MTVASKIDRVILRLLVCLLFTVHRSVLGVDVKQVDKSVLGLPSSFASGNRTEDRRDEKNKVSH